MPYTLCNEPTPGPRHARGPECGHVYNNDGTQLHFDNLATTRTGPPNPRETGACLYYTYNKNIMTKKIKKFTTLKVGYTAGVYGCSGEYFTTIVLDGDNVRVFNYYGMYGAEERVARTLKDAGYDSFYTPSDFGKMSQKDVRARGKFWESEYTAIESITDFLNSDK